MSYRSVKQAQIRREGYIFDNLSPSGLGPLAPLQDSTASASSLVSAMLILERIVSTNSPTEFIEARKEGSAISSALLQPRQTKFSGNPACLHTSPSNGTLATLPREIGLTQPHLNSIFLGLVRFVKVRHNCYGGYLSDDRWRVWRGGISICAVLSG